MLPIQPTSPNKADSTVPPGIPESVFGNTLFEILVREQEMKMLGCPAFCAKCLFGSAKEVRGECESYCELIVSWMQKKGFKH